MAQHPRAGHGGPELMTFQPGFSSITKDHHLYTCELTSGIKQQGDSVHSYKQHEAPFLLLKALNDFVSQRWVVTMTLAPERGGGGAPQEVEPSHFQIMADRPLRPHLSDDLVLFHIRF